MYLVIIAWIYVVLMMAAAEATSPQGTITGAVLTFLLYGAAPVSFILYLLGRRGPRGDKSAAPDGGGETPADPVAAVREEP